MALKTSQCRKRSFRNMRCDNHCSPIKATNHHINTLKPLNFQKRAVIHKQNNQNTNCYKTNNKHKLKFNYKFAYIYKEPPRKRQKVFHHSKKTKQCSIKTKSISPFQKPSKLRRKAPILHHCVINERWNMLTTPKTAKNKRPKQCNFPILGILNEYKPNPTPKTTEINSYYNPSVYSENNPPSNISTSSMDSFETAYDHFDDNDIPTISINDVRPLNIQNIQNPRNLHNDRCLFPPPIRYKSLINNKPVHIENNTKNPWSHNINTCDGALNDDFKWNVNHRSEQRRGAGYKENDGDKYWERSWEQLDDKRNIDKMRGNIKMKNGWRRDWIFSGLRCGLFLIIIWIMAVNYGGFNGGYILCDIMGLMCKDMDATLDGNEYILDNNKYNNHRNEVYGDKLKMDGNLLRNNENMDKSEGMSSILEREWMRYLILCCFIMGGLRSLYMIIKGYLFENEEPERFGFDYDGRYNRQNVMVSNYCNNDYIF